jgi:hypothetical protein
MIFMPAGASGPVYAPYTERFPPDTAAASRWLGNRQRARWGDKTEVQVVGPGGGPVQNQVSTSDPIEAARVYQKVMSES